MYSISSHAQQQYGNTYSNTGFRDPQINTDIIHTYTAAAGGITSSSYIIYIHIYQIFLSGFRKWATTDDKATAKRNIIICTYTH